MMALFYMHWGNNSQGIRIIITALVFMLLIDDAQSAKVYGPSPHFHTEYCGYNNFTPGGTNVVCLFAYPQPDVVTLGLGLAQLSKPSGNQLAFGTSYAFSSPYPYTSVTITVSVNGGLTSTLRLGFFIIVIKTPPVPSTPYMDLIHFNVDPSSALNNYQATVRSSSQLNNINIDSILTTALTSSLKLIPFTRNLIYYLDSAVTNDPRSEIQFMYDYQVTAYISNSIKHQLTIQPYTTMFVFSGFALMINLDLFQTDRNYFIANPSSTPNDFLLYSFTIGDPTSGSAILAMDFQGNFAAFGTSFNHKCILSIQRVKYTKLSQFEFHFQNNTYNSFQKYIQSLVTPSVIPQSVHTFFCHGYSVQCSDSTPYFDNIDGNCYTKAACPLGIPDAMPQPYRCGWCQQFICATCNPTNRLQCITCDPSSNSFLNTSTNKCECNAGFLTVYLDLSPQTYSMATQSLIRCSSNCTQSIQGCVDNQCVNSTYCSNCLPGYLPVPSGPNQYCNPCSVYISNCLQCSDTQFCTQCKDGYFKNDLNTNPLPPASPVLVGRNCVACYSNCKTCSDGSSCSQCFAGYITTACVCDPGSSGLQYCQTCTVNTACTNCIAGYFVSSITGLCQHCVENSIGCRTCSTINTCQTCINGYGLIMIGANTYCDVCFLNINYCDRCPDVNTCTHCIPPFGVDNPSLCTHCNTLKGPGCIECLNAASPCTKCNSLSFLINGTCFFCQIVHPQCLSCQINPTYQNLDCIQCQPGYYLHFNSATNTMQCFVCVDAIHKCQQCLNETYCTKCIYPNHLSSNNLCEDCDPNFINYDGVCYAETGCMNIYEPTPGNQTCLACRDYLHYDYNEVTHLCDCQPGYLQTINTVPLKKCLPICGDGILIISDQQCDDDNLDDYDGCDSQCNIQTNFQCSQTSPSKCILYQNFNKFDYIYVERILGENKGVMHFLIQPTQMSFTTLDWSKIISFNFSSSDVNTSQISYNYVIERGQLLVTVSYSQDLQSQYLNYTIIFDPSLIVSQPSSFTSTQQLNGINAALIIQPPFLLSTCRIFYIVSLVISILALVQFYIGSLVNKMIGLQTIQIIQLTFFIRIVISHKNTSILNCLNSFKFCSTGYSNPQVIFGTIGLKKNQQILHQFLQIGIQKYFLMNVNFWLLPIALAIILYFLLMIRRQGQKNNFLQQKQMQAREKFISMHRTLQWVYNHFLFPQLMMLVMIVHFSIVLSMQINQNYGNNEISKLYIQSIGIEMFLLFAIMCLFTHEILQSITFLLNPLRLQPLSALQKLQIDQQSPDRPNYHPFYVFTYLMFNFIQVILITLGVGYEQFHFAIQTILGLNIIYLLLIHNWQPYFKVVHAHNIILKLNYIIAILCLGIYEIIHRTSKLSQSFYVALASIMLIFIFLLIVGGFFRAFKQQQYRKKLKFASHRKFSKNTDLNDQINKKMTKKQRKQALLQNNSYTFNNQLQQIYKQHNIEKGFTQQKIFTQQHQQEIIKKIREQFKAKNNFYFDLIENNHKQPFQQGLIKNPIKLKQMSKLNQEQRKSYNPSQVERHQNNDTNQKRAKLSNPKKFYDPVSQDDKQTLKRVRGRLKAEWSYMESL